MLNSYKSTNHPISRSINSVTVELTVSYTHPPIYVRNSFRENCSWGKNLKIENEIAIIFNVKTLSASRFLEKSPNIFPHICYNTTQLLKKNSPAFLVRIAYFTL
jgi:hypothetical protein